MDVMEKVPHGTERSERGFPSRPSRMRGRRCGLQKPKVGLGMHRANVRAIFAERMNGNDFVSEVLVFRDHPAEHASPAHKNMTARVNVLAEGATSTGERRDVYGAMQSMMAARNQLIATSSQKVASMP